MTETDILSYDIDALKVEQRDAWSELSRPTLTAFDRRELRNRIRQSEVELRSCLKMRSEQLRFRPRPVDAAAGSPAKVEFRLF
jgi:hypothetical protein